MALTPEDIIEKEFLVGLRGYDKDEVRDFLVTVASDYREVIESAGAAPDGRATVATELDGVASEAAVEAPAATLVPGAGTGTTAPEAWALMGQEVAAVLRTAHEQVAELKVKGEADVAEHRRAVEAQADLTKVEAEKYAAELRTNAEAWAEARQTEADTDREEANRTLASSQDEALSLVADAQQRADRMLESTERRARERAEEVLAAARAQLAELQQSQSESHRRLQDARAFVGRAIDTFEATDQLDLDADVEVIGDGAGSGLFSSQSAAEPPSFEPADDTSAMAGEDLDAAITHSDVAGFAEADALTEDELEGER